MANFRIRPAAPEDAAELLRVRYEAIVGIEMAGESEDRIRRWAERRDIGWMERAVRERDTWVAIVNDKIMSWIGVENDRVEGLYTHPRGAGEGIGSALLQFVEDVLRSRGVGHISLEAGANVEGFYRRRGYETVGPGLTDGAQLMRKVLGLAPRGS